MVGEGRNIFSGLLRQTLWLYSVVVGYLARLALRRIMEECCMSAGAMARENACYNDYYS